MKVKTIAHTIVINEPDGWECNQEIVFDCDELVEMAGRNCYQSWDRPNPATATNAGYIRNILGQGHYSVLEHPSVTFYVSGVSTALLGQLTRHRHLSYSIESARYVNKSGNDMMFGKAMVLDAKLKEAIEVAMAEYNRQVDLLRASGLNNKEARQSARLILPQGISTSIVVTGNLRAWREFLLKRLSPGADTEIRELAGLILKELKVFAPNSFQDMTPCT